MHASTHGSKVRKSALFAESAPEARRLLRILGIGSLRGDRDTDPSHNMVRPVRSRRRHVITDGWPARGKAVATV